MATAFAEAELFAALPAVGPSPVEQDLALSVAALAIALFPSHDHSSVEGKALVITAPTPGEGASTICNLLSRRLAQDPTIRVFKAKSSDLERCCTADPSRLAEVVSQPSLTEPWSFAPDAFCSFEAPGPWSRQKAFREHLIRALRQQFDCVLIDCEPLGTSHALVNLASIADGVMLVVSAGHSSQSQVAQAKQAIETLGGKLEGCCFNRLAKSPLQRITKLWGRN